MSPSSQFIAVLYEADLELIGGVLELGRLTRCAVSSKSNYNQDGAYVYFEEGARAWGGYQNHTNGLGWISWRSDETNLREGLQEASERFVARMLAEERDREAKALRASHRAAGIYSLGRPLVDYRLHRYLYDKKLGGFGSQFGDIGLRTGAWEKNGKTKYEHALLMPILDGSKWASILAINTDGEKDLLYGGAKQGNFFYWGDLKNTHEIYLGEGLATMMSVAMMIGRQAAYVVGVDAGNLAAVAVRLAHLNQEADIILAADNDEAGLLGAQQAADAVSGKVWAPEEEGKDWSDAFMQNFLK